MKRIALVVCSFAFVAGCSVKKDESAPASSPAAQQPVRPGQSSAPARQDVSTEALAKIDPDVTKFDDAAKAAKKAFDAKKDAKTKAAVIDAYVRFGDYLTYDSPLSPRQGKYHRALIEYRHALSIDPQNAKAQREIKQIEEIYASMGRPIPTDNL